MIGLSNIYIDNLIRSIVKSNTYEGIFSSDNIPNILHNKKFSFICNLSPENTIGSHFIAITKQDNILTIWDSLNLKVKKYPRDLQEYIKKNICTYGYRKKIQDEQSVFCGFYCILNVLKFHSSKNINFIKFTSPTVNDEICIKNILLLL